MSFNKPGVRDGTGPFRFSWRRKNFEDLGIRKELGEECPFKIFDDKRRFRL